MGLFPPLIFDFTKPEGFLITWSGISDQQTKSSIKLRLYTYFQILKQLSLEQNNHSAGPKKEEEINLENLGGRGRRCKQETGKDERVRNMNLCMMWNKTAAALLGCSVSVTLRVSMVEWHSSDTGERSSLLPEGGTAALSHPIPSYPLLPTLQLRDWGLQTTPKHLRGWRFDLQTGLELQQHPETLWEFYLSLKRQSWSRAAATRNLLKLHYAPAWITFSLSAKLERQSSQRFPFGRGNSKEFFANSVLGRQF